MSRSFARGIPWAHVAGTLGLGGTALLLSPGCNGEAALPGTGGYPSDASVGGGFSPPPGPCETGSTRQCGVTLGTHDGKASCFEGVNECVDGHWSECRNGTETERPMPGASSSRLLSLSQATACANNPCDPRCRQWIEQPDGGYAVSYEGSFPTVPDGGMTFPWSQGPVPGYTGSGRNQPCTVAADCQMSMHCVSPGAGSCAHSQCATGAALTSTCNACVTAICASRPTCCSGSWTQQCVNDVATVCGATCTAGVNAGDPPRTEGTCEPWYPNETDASCSGFDLAIGPTCSNGIPVCNHGRDFAPAGATVTVYPAAQFKQASPTGATSTCTVPTWIAPGWCRMVQGCTVASGDSLVVSATASADGGSQSECRTDDNWSLYDNGACSDPVCSSNASSPKTSTVNLFFMLDQTSGAPERWAAMSNGLKTFLSDPDSAGVHVAFRLFPDAGSAGCTGTASACSTSACSTPAVEGDLASAVGIGSPCSASPDPTECSIFAALGGVTPAGDNTPTSAALAGAVAWAKQGKAARPNEEFAVVFITDGEPTSCDTNVANIAAIAADGYSSGVRTYVVGVEGLSSSTCQQIATAGGGAAQCVRVLSASGNTTAQTLAAIRSIAQGSVSCTLDLANQGTFDPSGATVNYTAGTTPSVTQACRPDTTEYGGHCYALIQADMTWSDARSTCLAFGNGWHLAAIESSGENTFANTLAAGNRAWLSGEDGTFEGTWSWWNGSTFPAVTSASPYANWTAGQPSGGSAENCAYLNGTVGGSWNDIDCPGATYTIYPLCEGPKEGDTSVTACPTDQYIGPDGRCYLVDTTLRTWSQSVAHCQALGMDLVNVTSAQDDLFLTKLISTDAWINTANYSGTWKRGDGTSIYTTSSTTCGPGETLYGGRCYSVTTAGTWSAASAACQASGSQFDLTKIESAGENGQVLTLAASTDSWISANDKGTEGTWRWSDNTQFYSGRECRSDETAVNGVCYHVETATPATWANAKTACGARGGKLVEIASSAKNADVVTALGSTTGAWIGATDAGTEGKWLWDSTSTWFWTGTGVSGCPAGTKTYNGHCYTNNGGGSLRWGIAQTTCHNLGLAGLQWELTGIGSDAENTWVFSNFTPAVAVWIGATRLYPCGSACQNGDDRWASTRAYWVDGTPWSYTHWDQVPAHQPDTAGNCIGSAANETVAEIQPDGYWNDDCDDNNNVFPYVCEAQAPSPIGQYVNWDPAAPVQPDAAAAGDDCAIIANSGTWSDVDCSAATRPYVCEVTQGTVVGGAYTNWATNQPAASTAAADCGVMTATGAAAGSWSDQDCSAPSRPGVCEGPLHSGPIGNTYNQWASGEPAGSGASARLISSGSQKGKWAGSTGSATYASVCAGTPTTTTYPGVLSPVASAANCTTDGQFYYDNASDPSTLTLCPKACTAVQGDGHGQLNVDVLCKPTTIAPHPPYDPMPLTTSFTQTYTPTCGQDQTPVWQFLAYDTSAPGGSSIDFDVRVGNDATSLAAASYKTVATVSAANANEVCSLTSPCLVDLFAQLGAADNNGLVLELRITLHPTAAGDAPRVSDWRITHTCKDNQ